MTQYIGVKLIQAEPAEQHTCTNTDCAEGIDGYKVIYPDGYVSWSPKDVFEEAYRPTDGMTFGLAIEAMKKGHKVAREGWNGKGMWIALVEADTYHELYSVLSKESTIVNSNSPYIIMKTANQDFQPGWLASQADILSDDWQIIL